MATKNRDLFLTIRSEGAILPPDLLQRIVSCDRDLEGLKPDDYHLSKSEKLNEATSRSWNRLLGAWAAFRPAAEKLPDADLGTSLTRERWLLPLFQELGYGRLLPAKAIEADGKSYSISHGWNRTPINLLGCGVDLDRPQQRTTTTNRSSPHSRLQETLNRSREHLWGFVTNGLKFRVLRDNASLTRQAYVEFDLEAMMLGESYADFVLLWLLCHQSRVEAENPNDCWLEKWSQASKERGVRALDQLRRGVEQAITALGRGFLASQGNRKLHDDLRSGVLDPQDYYRQLLRLVYRLLFLFSAEDRHLLLLPGEEHAAARERYLAHYSTLRLRRMAERRTGTRHTDLFASLRLIMDKLGMDSGCPELALPALGSFLFSGEALPDLEKCDISNFDLSEALRALAVTVLNGIRRPVDYKNLGAEELGSVYESLLELHPRVNLEAASFELSVASGHERKTTGSYYTQTSLIDCLLDSALEPVLVEAAGQSNPEQAILDLKIVDPACGSGHFLIAAAHRIARRLASIRTSDEEPSPDATRMALRDVIGHCIYGVDINPMAVELCKVNLWMEALEPGKPLSFLDNRLQCGDSLIGATPKQLASGIPDEAFDPGEGDDKRVCLRYKRLNRSERLGRQSLFDENLAPWHRLGDFAASLIRLDSIPDDTIHGIRQKEIAYDEAVRSSGYLFGKFWADTWCAAFAWRKHSDTNYAITEEVFRRIEKTPYAVSSYVQHEIEQLGNTYRFFHWHLAFPDVFSVARENEVPENPLTGWNGGFSVVLGNPPWIRYQTTTTIKRFLTKYETYRSTADLSVFFLERSVQITKANGRVALLTPNKWFGAGYGDALRIWLRRHAQLHLIIDFGHSRNLFPDADTFPAAIVMSPTLAPMEASAPLRFVKAHDVDRDVATLQHLVSSRFLLVPHGNLRPERWCLEDSEITALLDRLASVGVPLSTFAGRQPAMGINSGLNDAYYINGAERERLVDEDPKCTQWIKRVLRGRDLQRWASNWNGTWHIVLPSSLDHDWPWAELPEAEAEAEFNAEYPSLYRHLEPFQEALAKRTARGKFWWELRSCDYYSDYERPKILVQGIAYYSQFSLDSVGSYLNNMVAFIPSDDRYLLAVLNSRIVWWLINHTFQPRKDGGRSLDVQHLANLPIPRPPEPLKQQLAELAGRTIDATSRESSSPEDLERIELTLHQLLERAYGLTSAEVAVLERSLPPRDPIALLLKSAELSDRAESAVLVADAENVGHSQLPITKVVLAAVDSGDWSTPSNVLVENVALLSLIEVMRALDGVAPAAVVRLAATLVRKPAHALAFLDDERAREWVRAIGNEARPLASNVFNINHFRPSAADLPWSNAVAQLTATGAMRASGDLWVIGSNFPPSSGEPWIAGRAAFVVNLVSKVASAEAEQRMASFLRSVEDGTATRRAVS